MIVATLLMRDEEEIVRENIEHHLANGVDAFLVTLHRSMDRTREILREYPQVLDVYERQEEAYNQASWITLMAQEACRFKPYWIVHLDADEFWEGLKLLYEMPADVGLVTLTHAFEHRPEPDMEYGKFRREQMPRSERVPFNKVMHRPTTRIRIHQGNHGADRHKGKAISTDAITIHHYPIRSYEHFERKVVQGGQAYEASTMIVTSFFADRVGDSTYRAFADTLTARLNELHIQHCIEQMPFRDNWMVTCKTKPSFIERVLARYRMPLVWIDVDSSVERAIPSLDPNVYDIAAPQGDGHHTGLVSITLEVAMIYINYTPGAIRFLARWRSLCENSSIPVTDHYYFLQTWTELRPTNERLITLPKHFCNRNKADDTIVILHHSQSPAKKREVGIMNAFHRGSNGSLA